MENESKMAGENNKHVIQMYSDVSGAHNESVPHIICSPEESCWLAKIQVFR